MTDTNLSEATLVRAKLLTEHYLAKGDAVYLHGSPGIGKTELIAQIAREQKIGHVDFRLNLHEPVDMLGVPFVDPKTSTTKWMAPDALPQVKRDGERGILSLDEINTASDQMLAVALGLVLERRVGGYALPDGWFIIAAGNLITDKAAARRMSTALRNRFAHILVRPDIDAWEQWAKGQNVDPRYIGFIKFRPQLLHILPQGQENAFPSPRSHYKASRHIDAPKEIRQSLMAGHVGNAVAAEAESYFGLVDAICSLDDIIADPKAAPIPDRPDVRYAVVSGLALKANLKNWKKICQYADRLPEESKMLLIVDATTRTPELLSTPEYSRYAVTEQSRTFQAH